MRLLIPALLIPILVTAQEHGLRPTKLVVRNALVIEGNGTPASGPRDIFIEGDTITQIAPSLAATASQPSGTVIIDARGRYVMPGLINLHGHVQDERAGIKMPSEYQLKLWLASGITTVRDLGSDFAKSSALREQSKLGQVAAPRLFLYRTFSQAPAPRTPDEARERIRLFKREGADGVKFFDLYRDIMEAALDEAHRQGLRGAHHAAIAETNAWDDIKFGMTTIEHWYGIPDAALPNGVQSFPAGFNVAREIDRFRYSGRLWREANPTKLLEVLDGMVKANVGWDPTLNIYEAARDLQRYQNQPWFPEYLHPALERFFAPNPEYHGSFFEHWTTTDEAYWRENYRLWMAAVREFARRGGIVGVGEDTGFIYNLYGFGLIRGLELHQEAGFAPLQVIQHATANNGHLLGQGNRLGRLRVGYAADLLILNGNPLEDFKFLYPPVGDAKAGIEWTIKDGIPYSVPQLIGEVKGIVSAAKKK